MGRARKDQSSLKRKEVEASGSVDARVEIIGQRKQRLASTAQFDPVVAFKMKKGGLTYKEIAEILTPPGREKPLSEAAIQRALDRLVGKDQKHILSSKYLAERNAELKRDLMEEKHVQALKAITPKKLKKESAKDNAMTAKMLHEQLRLEENKSTKNVAVSFAGMVERSAGGDGL